MDDVKEIIRRAMSAMGHLRARKLTAEQRQDIASAAGKASWADLTAEQRSVEMKRRAKVRKRNRARKNR
jgi:hypothetical protein